MIGTPCDVPLPRKVKEKCMGDANYPSRHEPEHPLLEKNPLVLQRAFIVGGTNRQFVNGSPTTLATLATLGEWLVDMHGPHEHQSLLQPAKQLAILDAFGKLEPKREEFAALVRERSR